MLVSKDSATNGCILTHPLMAFQINDDHSGMVKFSYGDARIGVVVNSILDIVEISPAEPLATKSSTESAGKPPAGQIMSASPGTKKDEARTNNLVAGITPRHHWIIQSLSTEGKSMKSTS